MSNPARLSMALAALFPSGVVAAQLSDATQQSAQQAWALLSGAEARCVAQAALARRRDFAAGRACAHRALARFGVAAFSLLPTPHRAPRWPAPLTGSITHTTGYSAAVVGERILFGGLGLDSEVIADVKPALWPSLCTPAELARLLRLPASRRQRAAALTFVAKEAFYKCQFSLTGEPLGFADVCIDWEGADGEGQPPPAQPVRRFAVHPQRSLRLDARQWGALECRYRFGGPLVTAGVAVCTGRSPPRRRMRFSRRDRRGTRAQPSSG